MRASNAAMMSSGVSVRPSSTRIRPENAARAASSNESKLASPRSSSSPRARSTMSIDPRTDDPVRNASCVRVARASATETSVASPLMPVTRSTIRSSAAWSWYPSEMRHIRS
jgi:hypothetical protein